MGDPDTGLGSNTYGMHAFVMPAHASAAARMGGTHKRCKHAAAVHEMAVLPSPPDPPLVRKVLLIRFSCHAHHTS